MVRRIFKQIIPFIPAFISISLLLFMIGGAITALLIETQFSNSLNEIKDGYTRYVVIFTMWQAFLSTAITLFLSILIARALHRRRKFFGRSILLNMFSIAFILPSIVLVLGIAVIHGKNGWVNNILENFGFSFGYYLYGMFGVLLGHVAFSMPLAIRVILGRLDSIPPEIWRVSSQLGLSSTHIFKLVEWPILKTNLVGLTALIYMMCFTSFVIVLALGGGPFITTIEVAIYQALKFDFDINKAVILSIFQLVICLILLLLASKFSLFSIFTSSKKREIYRPDCISRTSKIIDFILISLAFIIIILPLFGIIFSGLDTKYIELLYSKEFWSSFSTSIYLAIASGLCSLIISAGIITACFRMKYIFGLKELSEKFSYIANLSLLTPPFIFATGLFILINNMVDIYRAAPYLIVLTNSLMALPFVMSVVYNSAMGLTDRENWLCQNLGINGWNFFKIIYWQHLKKAASYAFSLGTAMSWGDLSIIALFGNKNLITLPYLLYQKMSSYRIGEASLIALAIVTISFILFWFVEDLFDGEKNARA